MLCRFYHKKRCFELKNAQLTVFVIIGLVMLAAAAILYYANARQNVFVQEEIIEPQLVPQLVAQEIVSCVNDNAPQLIKRIASHGGELNPVEIRIYKGVIYNYFCRDSGSLGCLNRLITRSSVENELNSALAHQLARCFNFSSFKRQGYSISEADLTVATTIAVDHVQIVVTYPIIVEKGDYKVENPMQSIVIALPLGKLLDLAVMIANSEIDQSFFDKDTWMYSHPDVGIEKHKPYPDTVYSLSAYVPEVKDSLQLNFAVQGKDTIALIGQASRPSQITGYCVMQDGNCYYNSLQQGCLDAHGRWQQNLPKDCIGPSAFVNQTCKDCLGCGDRSHGESWCEYESIAGSGLDFVGSQHFVKSCFNGKIYTEECRDFREELCTEENMNGKSKASCRPNRWQDCAAQTTKEQCQDISKRDCQWSDWLLKPPTFGVIRKDHLCSPFVPPGFRFWQNQGGTVCGMASEQRTCDGLSCPQQWVDSVAAYCFYMGDCGNYYNVAGDFSSGGYFNTDTPTRDIVYPSPKTVNMTLEPLHLPIDFRPPLVLTGHEYDNKIPVEKLMDGISKYLSWLSRQNPSDYVKHYLKYGTIDFHVVHTAFCMPWSAPFGGNNCGLCNHSTDRPCTEYKCHSLGQTCEYEEKNGFGLCFSKVKGSDTTGPKLTFDSRWLTENYTAKRQSFGDYDNCWHLNKYVPPYTVLSFGFNTSEEASCKMTPLPLNYTLIPSVTFSNFTTVHKMLLKVTSYDQMKDQFMSALGLRSILEIAMLDQYRQVFNRTKTRILKIASKFGMKGAPIIAIIDKLEAQFYLTVQPAIAKSLSLVERIVVSMEAHQGVVFIRCIDRSGNENKDEFCVWYDLSEDREPPHILSAFPANKTIIHEKTNLTLTLNEPSECRYSLSEDKTFEAMTNLMNCSFSELATYFGSYTCTSNISIDANPTVLFIRCVDQPIITQSYKIILTRRDKFVVLKQEYGGAIKLSNKDLINITNDFVLKANDTNVEVNTSEARIFIDFGNQMNCRYSQKDMPFDDSQGVAACTGDYCELIEEVPADKILYMKCQPERTKQRNVNRNSYVLVYGS